MKKFILSILCVVVFFVGLGSLVDKAGAKFRSDDKALELVRKARIAIGGEAALSNIQSLLIVGKTTKSLDINKTVIGETEIAMQLPNKLTKRTKLAHSEGSPASEAMVRKQIDVVVLDDGGPATRVITDPSVSVEGANGAHKVIIRKLDGSTQELGGADAAKFHLERGDGDKIVLMKSDKTAGAEGDKQVMISRVHGAEGIAAHGTRHNEMLRLTLALLMSAPQGMDVDYQLGGEGDVDGTPCNIVVAGFGGSSFRIYLNKSTDLPVMMSYTGVKMPAMIKLRTGLPNAETGAKNENISINHGADAKVLERAEFNVKFDDYRSVGGVQLPYKWTQTVGGIIDETFVVSAYEINPANIADKFKNEKVMIRTKKPIDQ